MRFLKIFLLITITLVTSCKKTSVATENFFVAFKASLTGTAETPANASRATGTADASYNKNSKVLTIYITFSGLTATGAHIHKGAAGVPGVVVFNFTNFASPITYSSVALDATQEADLLANLYYVNIHSAAYPNGEIRGQLIRQ